MEQYPQPFTPRDSWPPGTVVKDDYVIESRLGKGGFGTVYKAKHRYLQSDHVIKRLHEEYSSDEEYVHKFIAEGQVIRRLRDCPYVVTVEHMTLTADQYLILIMEFMPGGDLCKLMQERRTFTIADACGYAVQIAEGLRAAHAIELIHRDVKPANILLAANQRKAKLTDFGIAADHHSSQATSVVRGGSLGYAAPEQWTTSGRNLDGRTDIYALGVTMYHMLTQVMPYQASDIGAWIDAVRTTQPLQPNRLREDVPEDLNRLIMQMIEVRREHRPANIEAVIECLKPYADAAEWHKSATLRVPSTPPPVPPRDASPWQPTVPPPPPPPPSNPPPHSQPLPMPPVPQSYTPTQYEAHPQPYQPPYTPQPQPHSPPLQPPYTPPLQQPPYTPQPQPYAPPPYQPQQPQPWTGPPQQILPQPAKPGGGAGKWLVIVPLLLALAGGGGWYGWKATHPVQDDENTTNNEGTKTKDKDKDPPSEKVDWIKQGDEARDRGDYHEAVKCFRKQPSGAARIAGLLTLVEADVVAKVAKFSDVGQFDKADALVTEWLADFPKSEKLQEQKDLIARRRAAQ